MSTQATGPGSLYDADGTLVGAGVNMPAGAGAGRVPTSDASGNLTLAAGMSLLAATPVAGYTLVNGTGNIISWTAPNDGLLHRVLFLSMLDVTSGPETGGLIQVTVKAPDGTSGTFQVQANGQGAGIHTGSTNPIIVQAGQAVTVAQNTALTAGAAVLWCEIWGS